MTRHTRTTLLAAGAAATLLLTACGGSGNGSEEIDGIDEGGNEREEQVVTEDPEPTAEEEGVERPEIVLPDGVENLFEGWESNDSEEQAVLRDAQAQVNAMDLAVIERDPNADYVSFYTSAEALINGRDWIQGFVDNELTIQGTVRYLEPTLELEGGSATLSYCADESEAESVYLDTGEVLESDTHSEIYYVKTLQLDERGVWMTVNVHDERGVCS